MNKNCVNNLIPNSKRTTKELKEMGRKGGIASGESKRRARLWREIIEDKMTKPIEEVIKSEKNKRYKKKYGADIVIEDGIINAQIEKGLAGDTKSAEFLRDTMGQKPTEKVEIQPIDNEAYNKVEQWVNTRLNQSSMKARENTENDKI